MPVLHRKVVAGFAVSCPAAGPRYRYPSQAIDPGPSEPGRHVPRPNSLRKHGTEFAADGIERHLESLGHLVFHFPDNLVQRCFSFHQIILLFAQELVSLIDSLDTLRSLPGSRRRERIYCVQLLYLACVCVQRIFRHRITLFGEFIAQFVFIAQFLQNILQLNIQPVHAKFPVCRSLFFHRFQLCALFLGLALFKLKLPAQLASGSTLEVQLLCSFRFLSLYWFRSSICLTLSFCVFLRSASNGSQQRAILTSIFHQ